MEPVSCLADQTSWGWVVSVVAIFAVWAGAYNLEQRTHDHNNLRLIATGILWATAVWIVT